MKKMVTKLKMTGKDMVAPSTIADHYHTVQQYCIGRIPHAEIIMTPTINKRMKNTYMDEYKSSTKTSVEN